MADEPKIPVPRVMGWSDLRSPIVSKGEPVWMQFGMMVEGEHPVEVETYDSGQCFLAEFIDLNLDPGGTATKPLPRCAPVRIVLEPGALWKTSPVDLSVYFELTSKHQVSVRFRDGKGFVWGGWSRDGAKAFLVQEPVLEGKIDRAHPLTLPQGTLTFRGHGHKRMRSNSRRSPLMISMTWTPIGGREEVVSVSIDTQGSRQFEAGPYTLEMLDHRYNDWMELRVYP